MISNSNRKRLRLGHIIMKIILMIIVAISVWSNSNGFNSKEWADLGRTLKEECKKEIGIEEVRRQKVHQTVVDKSDILLLKYVQCVGINGGFVDEDGNVNVDFIKPHLRNLGIPEDVITESTQNCVKKSEDILLKIVYYYECYREYLPARVFAV
ncbi:uncharacterized protein LOC123688855 [Harmonia axyridis]|uniref:uncharacterized protein LOC123688855 n=1 Tax=Harmonia axyridis TaxID=115357 RepID=UPI001E278801|nr:uncharacterized protein LOC123688855 [Harmonia axyridis]